MSWGVPRRWWWVGCAASASLLLAPGTAGGTDAADARTSSPAPGSPTNPQLLTCRQEATQFTGAVAPIGPHDIGFGSGYFPQARRLADARPLGTVRNAQLFGYKLPPVVYPGATVTITIARDARSYVVQQNPWSKTGGSLAVTYQSCQHKKGFFPQSFRFTDGRRRGCVPLDVQIGGQNKTRHIVLSLFAGRCRTSS